MFDFVNHGLFLRKKLFLFFILCAATVSSSPYILEKGPEKGAGLPFLDADLSVYYKGVYSREDSGFRAAIYYTVDEQDLFSLSGEYSLDCLNDYNLRSIDVSSPGFPYKHVLYIDFDSKGWNPYFRPEEDPEPQKPKTGFLFFVVINGNVDELCVFIPVFTERLRYYMNARKQELLLPLPAVLFPEP